MKNHWKGSLGKIYLVSSSLKQRLYIIKEIKPEQISRDLYRKFKKEAQVMQSLTFPNILYLKETRKNRESVLNLVWEYADDKRLVDQIRERKYHQDTLQEGVIVHYFTQIVLALKYCHDRKILHGDIRSKNIFVTRRGLCKLGKFKFIDMRNFMNTGRNINSVLTAPNYLAPEIFQCKPYN